MKAMRLLFSAALYAVLAIPPVWSSDDKPPGRSAADLADLDLEQLMEITVRAASLHEQSLEDAPASVTIITQDELRRYGWRTLGEALGDVAGLYTANDRSYTSLGVRGFGLPGDGGTRFLLMVNGHSMADNIFSQTRYFEQNFPLDITLVQRIEVIRGPSSALYGSNGIFAAINVVTFSPQNFQSALVRVETGSFGEKKVQAASSVALGRGAAVLLSASVFNNSGEHSIYFSQADSPATNFGRAIDMNAEKGYHLFGDLVWHDWQVTALFGGSQRIQPISWGPAIFNDRGTRVADVRNFVEATYTHNFDDAHTLQWRTSYDSYRGPGIFHYPLGNGVVEDSRNFFSGDWIGTQVSYRTPVPHFGVLTVGSQTQFDLRALQRVIDVQPAYQEFLRIDKRDRSIAFFAQDEWELTRKWKLDLGARFDYSHYRPSSVSPRVALIYQPSSKLTYKVLYGHAFRNPTAYELFYDDGFSTAANPAARPEKAHTVEFDIERKLTPRLDGTVTAYRYAINDLLVGAYTPDGLFQFRNAEQVRASGLEFGIHGHPVRWLDLATSLSLQRAVNLAHNYPLPGSPGQVGKLRLSVPLFSNRFSLSIASRYMGSQQTLGGATAPSRFLSDITVSSKRLPANFEFEAGVRNLAGTKYVDPIALAPGYDTMPQPGRTAFLTLTWHSPH